MNRVGLGCVALALTGAVLAGCGSSSSGADNPVVTQSTSTAAASQIAGCTPSTLKTKQAGVLTLAADKPAYPPWYVNNDPTNGKGFEDAVSYAIAHTLGYDDAHVKWVRATFNQSISPAPKPFDLFLDEFSITPAREKAVDFSSPYYDVNEGIVAMKGSKAAGVTTLAGLKTLKLGAQIGTTNESTITDVIKPSQSAAIYNSNAVAIQALKNGQIDALVVDLPTAFYITSAQLPNAAIIGQLPAGAHPEQFGALLSNHSPLTSCVSKAVDALRSNGQLAAIQQKWLAEATKAPVLR